MEGYKIFSGDRSIVLKKADKFSCVVVYDRNDYVVEAEKQLSNSDVYRENILSNLSEASRILFGSLKRKGFVTEKHLKYFTYEYKKATYFGNIYLHSKIHRPLLDVLRRRVISNCGAPTKKCSEFLDYEFLIVIH